MQIVVDQKNKLLVEHDVTNEVIDLGLLSAMANTLDVGLTGATTMAKR